MNISKGVERGLNFSNRDIDCWNIYISHSCFLFDHHPESLIDLHTRRGELFQRIATRGTGVFFGGARRELCVTASVEIPRARASP